MTRTLPGVALLAILSASTAHADDADAFFEAKVRPILVARCLECHGDLAKPKGGLRLTSREAILKGGDAGVSIVEAIRYVDEPRMPPKGKLPEAEIAVLERWIASGMAWPKSTAVAPVAAGAEFKISDEQRRFWSFQPVRAVEPPAVKSLEWPINPVDRFVLARLEAEGLNPAPQADRATLIRRATFDLTGLPPTPEAVDAFLADPSPTAYEAVVDRLLASPAYGQRWARHWLDVVRYADSRDARGVGGSDDIGEAWRYRDWVVDAFNRDLPYDRFIINQVAGDQIPGPDPTDINPDGMVATGLLTIGEWGHGDADKEKMLTDLVTDQVDVVTRGFLGLTVACARCHDHKFDPISAADYYGLAGIFFSTRILPDPGAKTAGSAMLRTSIATRADREAIVNHDRRLAQAVGELSTARNTAREALARSLVPRIREAIGPDPQSDMPPFARRKWAACLGETDLGRPLNRAMPSVQGLKGVDFWAAQADPPWVGVNSGDTPATISTLTLPPRSVDLHPGPKTAAAIRWRSPVDGFVSVRANLADADPNGGNGVTWSVVVRSGRSRHEVASGVMENASKAQIGGGPLDRIEVHVGDSVELAVGPRGDYSFDSTTVGLKIDRLAPEGMTWDLAADLLPDLLTGNPHADRLGHAAVWELVEIDPTRSPRPMPDHPAWADWDRSDRSNEALEAFARAVEADPKLVEALVGEGGPFRPDVGDDSALPEAARDEVARLKEAVDRLKREAPPRPGVALVALEGGVPKSAYEGFRDARIHVRGDYRRLGPVVPRHVPSVVEGENPPKIEAGSGRMELARWIASDKNPLTARVMVNRVWQGHFGSGLVRTPGNFGKLGEAPTHPELLDWLADRFVKDGWSIKRLHRLMMTSRTYQQSSRPPVEALKADPENRLWGRMDRRRLESEAVRDALLAASGKLDLTPGGPSTRDFNNPRRTLYQMTIRSDRSSFGPLFDAADSTAMVDRRVISTVAPQALFLMNHPFVIDQAKALSDRLTGDDSARMISAYRLLYAREPTDAERSIGLDLLAKLTAEEGSAARAWEAYAQVLLCSNEFLYVD